MPQDHIRAKVIYIGNAAPARVLRRLGPRVGCSPDPGPAGFDFSLLDAKTEEIGETGIDDQFEPSH
jgi:hypothetical protein